MQISIDRCQALEWARMFGLASIGVGLAAILARILFFGVIHPAIFPSLFGGIGTALCGLSLYANAGGVGAALRHGLALGAAIGALTIALVSILLYSLGILGGEGMQAVYMPFNTALAYLFLSGALLTLVIDGSFAAAAQALAAGSLVLSLLVLIGYAYSADLLTAIGGDMPMALPTALTIGLMSAGVLLIRRDTGVMKSLMRPTPGGYVLRRSIVPLILIPILLIWLVYAADIVYLLGSHLGLALAAVGVVTLLIVTSWGLAGMLDRANAERLRYEEERARSEAHLRDLLDTVGDHAIYSLDADGCITTWNRGAERTLGFDEREVLGQSHERFFTQQDIDAGLPARLLREAAASGRADLEHWSVRKDGSLLYVRDTVTALRKDGGIAGYAKVTHDISPQKRSLEEKAMLASILETVFDPVIVIDEAGIIERVNPATEKVFGFSAEEMTGKNVSMLMPSPYREAHDGYIRRYIETGVRRIIGVTRELTGRRQDGTMFPIELQISEMLVGDRRKFTGVVRDISERKALEARMIRMAQHDALTGLPNRALTFEFGEKLLTAARRERSECAVFFIDMDRFKAINDMFGHEAGDAVLREVAERLQSVVRGEDLIGRLGGDEFLVVLSHVHPPQGIRRVAAHCLVTLGQPYRYGDVVLDTSPSIGISVFPADGWDMDALVKNADAAMYHAKQRGRNNFQFFSAEMNSPMAAALLLDRRLREVVDSDSFVLHYQPIVHAESLRVSAAEALIRWPGNDAAPSEFISVAESNGVIYRLGEWTLTAACRQLRVWRDKGMALSAISVNISPLQLRQPEFAEIVARALGEHDIAPRDLRLEITEALRPKQVKEIAPVLEALKRSGVQIALDGLGADYSGLHYLQSLPIDAIKIDRHMISETSGKPPAAALVSAIIGMANEMGLPSITEGIESETELEFVRRRRCSHVQGNLIAQPMSACAFEAWYRAAQAVS